jgi:hypothetical protein
LFADGFISALFLLLRPPEFPVDIYFHTVQFIIGFTDIPENIYITAEVAIEHKVRPV